MVAPGRLVTLEQSSLVLGVDPDYLYEPVRAELPERFRLVCATDGLLEATNAGGEAIGEQRLHEALLDRDAFSSSAAVLAKISQLWTSHLAGSQPDDDVLILVVGAGGAPPESPA
jgi:serine phosphatase RsbU (regulator of sigma subunit)